MHGESGDAEHHGLASGIFGAARRSWAVDGGDVVVIPLAEIRPKKLVCARDLRQKQVILNRVLLLF